jgi:hypothetical protein
MTLERDDRQGEAGSQEATNKAATKALDFAG